MSIKNSVIRGNMVTWTTNFFDMANNVIQANSATLRLRHQATGEIVTLSMQLGPDGWTASFDTSNVKPGIINWHASCIDPVPSAQDGYFRIDANPANPGP